MLRWYWETFWVLPFRAGHGRGDAIVQGLAGPTARATVAMSRDYRAAFELARHADAALAAGRLDAAREGYRGGLELIEGVHLDVDDPSARQSFAEARAVSAVGMVGGLANVERAAGHPDRALDHALAAVATAHETFPGTAFEAVQLNRVGVAHFDAGSAVEAVDAHERALRMLDDPAPAPPSELGLPEIGPELAIRAVALSSLGNAYALAGNRERALDLAGAALSSVPEAAVGTSAHASCLSNAAVTMLWLGVPAVAAEQLEQALAIETASPDSRDRLVILSNLGQARLELGDDARARVALEEAERILRSRDVRGTAAVTVLNNLAALNERSGRPETAAALFREATAAPGTASPELAWAHTNLAVHLLDAGDLTGALDTAETAVRIAEEVRHRVRTPTGREQLSERMQIPYQVLITVRYAHGDAASHARAFTVAEMSRARGLADAVGLGATAGARTGAVPAEERRLRRHHARVRRELRRADADAVHLSATERRLAWEVETALRQRLDAGSPRWDPPDLATVQRALGARTLLLSFEVNSRGTFAWSVRASGAVMLRLAGDGRDVLSLVAVAIGNYRDERPSDEAQRDAQRELGRLLLGQLPGHHLADAEDVVVVSGVLGHLPLDLLPVDVVPLAPGRLLGDLLPVAYLPSAWTLLALRARGREHKARGLLGIAPDRPDAPLPAARREMRAASDGFPGAEVLTSPAATEAAVLAALPGFRYVHLACHGHLDEEQPLQSGVLLDPPTEAETAADPDAGDVLHLHAVLDAGLSADLVLCTGCETALGRLREGEGMVGFATAFLAAGAGALVLTLWPVVDGPTARLVEALYAELREGTPPVTALWRAKRAVRAAHPGLYTDPREWAGFVAVGLPADT